MGHVATDRSVSEVLDRNPVTSNSVMNKMLHRMLQEHTTVDLHGRERQVTGGISQEEAEFIHSLIIDRGCQTCMETGVAYGVSTIAICQSLFHQGNGCHHYGVDPCQYSDYDGAALAALQACGLEGFFELLNGPSHTMLPQLLARNVKLDLALIDGWHTFDYTLLDVFYADKMLRPGGILLIHDMDLPSKRKVWGFLKTHRRYRRIEHPADKSKVKHLSSLCKGLATAKRSAVKSALFGLAGIERLIALEKLDDWEPGHNYFRDF